MTSISVAVLGASGFSGATLVSLLLQHPQVSIEFLGTNSHESTPLSLLYPRFSDLDLPTLQKNESLHDRVSNIDAIFCCLPNEASTELIPSLLLKYPNAKIIDLSAALRIKDKKIYKEYYQHDCYHELASKSIYGLSEIYRKDISNSSIIANPGCYTTTALLPLIPLLENSLLSPQDIIIDAKSGVSGAGRKPDINLSYTSVAENFKAYGIEGHRHEPEIKQELDFAINRSNKNARESSPLFIPHLLPMTRGILATIYVVSENFSSRELYSCLNERYFSERFVKVLPFGDIPTTSHVNHTNMCVIGIAKRKVGGRHIIVSVTDNLIKGAAGQALQNLNIMMGWQESLGLNSTIIPL